MICIAYDQRKFIAAIAGKKISRAYVFGEVVEKRAKDLITNDMSVSIVYILESIQVHHDNREIGTHALCMAYIFLKALVQRAAIGQAGDTVSIGLRRSRGFG